jgi:hypothetical protein
VTAEPRLGDRCRDPGKPKRKGDAYRLACGIGKPDGVFAQPKTGLGTGIVKALSQQLGAKVETVAGPKGTSVSITHATFLTKEIRGA